MYTQVLLSLQGGEASEFQALGDKHNNSETVRSVHSVHGHSHVGALKGSRLVTVNQYQLCLLLWDTLEIQHCSAVG